MGIGAAGASFECCARARPVTLRQPAATGSVGPVYPDEALGFADAGVTQGARVDVGKLHAGLLLLPPVFQGHHQRAKLVDYFEQE
jgi:hypothetical protein